MKLKSLVLAASFLLFLPPVARADGPLLKGDTAHPISCLVQNAATGNPVNGDTLVMHITTNGSASTIIGTGAFSQPDTTYQSGVEYYTLSAADAAALGYGEALFQASDTTTPGNIINPERRTVVAYNPFDPSLLGLTGVATAATQTANGATLTSIAAIVAKFQFDVSNLLKVNVQVLPSTAPAGYGGSGGSPVIHR